MQKNNLFQNDLALLTAEFSKIAYLNSKKDINNQLSIIKVNKIGTISPNNKNSPFRAVYGQKDNNIIIAFRGTVLATHSSSIREWQQMISCILVNVIPIIERTSNRESIETNLQYYYNKKYSLESLHYGFALGLEELWDELNCILNSVIGKYKIIFTGHSLGGV